MINTLFLDIGGVLLTNGWGHELRQEVAKVFHIDYKDFASRHDMIFDLFERGKMTFDEYLKWTLFHERRRFTCEEIKNYIFQAAKPFVEMIALIKELKQKKDLRIIVVSNEGREIALDRIKRFDLASFVDFFIVSSFVHLRKPDHEIYHLAIDVSGSLPSQICYIDDRKLLVESGAACGLNTIHHQDVASTRSQLAFLGL